MSNSAKVLPAFFNIMVMVLLLVFVRNQPVRAITNLDPEDPTSTPTITASPTLTFTPTITATPTFTPTPLTGLTLASTTYGCTSGPYITCSASIVTTHTDPYRWDFDITYTYGDNKTWTGSNFTFKIKFNTGIYYDDVPIWWNMYPITNEVMPNRRIDIVYPGVPDLASMDYPSGTWTVPGQPIPYNDFTVVFSRTTTAPEILVRTDKWHLTIATYPNVATPTNTPTPTYTPTATFTPIATATPTDFQDCLGGLDYEVQGVTGNNGVNDYYGVQGRSHVWDPIVTPFGAYVNSVWIIQDSQNIVELGWYERGGSDERKYFRTWTYQGIYHEETWGSPATDTDHEFKVYNNGVYGWEFYVDNVVQSPSIELANFYLGDAGAMRERHNTCDSGWAHWWDLQRYDYYGNWITWQTMAERNYDPPWFLNIVSLSEFYVSSP